MSHYDRFYPDGWMYDSRPEVAARHLQLDLHLDRVPEGGTVYDIGSGYACSLGAAIFLRRPDLTIVNVDPGYAFEAPGALHDTVEGYDEQQQGTLLANDAWYSNRLPDFADSISAPDGSANMIVSYAALPEHTVPIEAGAREMMRLLSVGGIALLGPIDSMVNLGWRQALEESDIAEQITRHDFEVREVEFPHMDEPLELGFSVIYK